MRLLARGVVVILACRVALAAADPAPEPPPSDNPFLTQARAQIDQLQYDLAQKSLGEALNLGKSGPAEVAEILRLTGEMAATLGQRDDAEQSFRRLLAVDATAQPRAGVSPKLAEPFQAAQAFYQTHRPLQLSHQIAPGGAAIAVIIDSDPMAMVVAARATYRLPGGQEQSVEARGSGKITLALPRAPGLTLVVAGLDVHGNRLVEDGSWASPIVIAGETAAPPKLPVGPAPGATPARRSRPIYARWWLWGGLAASAAALGVVFGLKASSDQSDLDALNKNSSQHDFSEASAVASRGKSDALIANLGIGTAAALGVVATVLLLRGEPAAQPAHASRAGSTALVLMATPGGPGLGLTGTFK